MRNITKAYYSKIQQRFVSRDEYFDDLLYSTLKQDDIESNHNTNNYG